VTVGLDKKELVALINVAEADSPRSAALITLMALNGLRIGEALSCDVDHLSYDFGNRIHALARKGDKRTTEALAPATTRALETHKGERTADQPS